MTLAKQAVPAEPTIDAGGAVIDTAISLALGRREELRVPAPVVSSCAGALRRIFQAQPDVMSLAVTSALAREGRSTVAAGMAISLATTFERPTVLVDADDHGNSVPGESAHEPEPSGPHPPVEWIAPDLGVLALWGWVQPEQRADRKGLAALLDRLRALEVFVIADLPALPPVGSADQLAGPFDAAVQVVRAGSTRSDAAIAAGQSLGRTPFVVLNATHSAIPKWLSGRSEI